MTEGWIILKKINLLFAGHHFTEDFILPNFIFLKMLINAKQLDVWL